MIKIANIAEIRAGGTELLITPRPIYEPLNAPEPFKSKLGRFRDNYDLSTSSHLYRFLLAVCGEAGAGSIKRELLYPKLQTALESTHFYDLDRLYGDPLALPRIDTELYSIDPRNEVMTQAEWHDVQIKDAQYRARCLTWMRAIMEGGSVRGVALAAEAATGVECEVFERYKWIENLASDDPITIPDIGKTASTSEFVILPRTDSLTEGEKRRITKMVDRLRPVNTVFSTHLLADPRDEQHILNATASSHSFYVSRYVTGRSDITWPTTDLGRAYWIESGVEKETPMFAWFARQEAATFLSISSATASSEHVGRFNPEQRALFSHLINDDSNLVYDESYSYAKAFAPVQLTSPWTRTHDESITLVNQYYPLGYFAEAGLAQLPADDPANFWSSTQAYAPEEETLVIDLGSTRPVNFLDLEICYKPIDMTFEYSTDNIAWTAFVADETYESQSQVSYLATADHPWNYTEHHFDIAQARYIRITFVRREDLFPFLTSEAIEWSIEVRNLRAAHLITAAQDFVVDAGTDILGNSYRTDLNELSADNLRALKWELDSELTVTGGILNDASRALNTQGDGLSGDSSFGIWEATTNLVLNGGYETNTTGAGNNANAAVALSTTEAKFGTKSLLVTQNAAGEFSAFLTGNLAAAASTAYTFSVWVKAGVGASPIAITAGLHNGAIYTSYPSASIIAASGSWVRHTLTFTTAADTTTVRLFVGTSGVVGTGNSFLLDGAQLEQQPIATPYVHTDGATATRTGPVVKAPASLVSETQGWIAFRLRPGWNAAVEPYGGAGRPYLFNWDGGGGYINAWYNEATNRAGIERFGTIGGVITMPWVPADGVEMTFVAAWTATELKVSINGAPFDSIAHSSIPELTDTDFEIGSTTGGSQFDGDFLWFSCGIGELTDTDAAAINAYFAVEGDVSPQLMPGQPTAIMPFNTIDYLTPSDTEDLFWQSQPNPVPDAVESLYFDMRTTFEGGTMSYLDASLFVGGYTGRSMEDMALYEEDGVILDEIWLDPITFGPTMHFYYSNDDYADFDYKLWIPIPRHYVLKKGFHSLPSPVYAKYFKIEFSSLSPAPYNSLDYPISPQVTYRKFPSWVQSHFVNIYEGKRVSEGDFNTPFDRVTVDPLKLGFLKQTDRLHSDFNSVRSEDFVENEDEIKNFILSITKVAPNADVVQQTQESQVNFRSSFMWQNDLLSDLDRTRALSRYIQNTETDINAEAAPPVEAAPDTQSVSDLSQEKLRKELPTMFFPRKCRHEYQILRTTRPTKVAYYVAVRDVKFYRRNFTIQYDELAYFENLTDNFHTATNEFTEASDWGWVVTP